MGFNLGVQFQMMTKWIALGVTAIAGLVYVHYYASARLEAMPEKMRSSPAEINAQHQLELKIRNAASIGSKPGLGLLSEIKRQHTYCCNFWGIGMLFPKSPRKDRLRLCIESATEQTHNFIEWMAASLS
jgi:hypothetical protein